MGESFTFIWDKADPFRRAIGRTDVISKDRRKSAYLKRHGWIILRLQEGDLQADWDVQIERVLATVNGQVKYG